MSLSKYLMPLAGVINQQIKPIKNILWKFSSQKNDAPFLSGHKAASFRAGSSWWSQLLTHRGLSVEGWSPLAEAEMRDNQSDD